MRVVLVVRKLSYHQHCCHHQHWACTHHAAGSFSAQFCAFLMWSAETAFTATSIFSTRVMSGHDCLLADPVRRTTRLQFCSRTHVQASSTDSTRFVAPAGPTRNSMDPRRGIDATASQTRTSSVPYHILSHAAARKDPCEVS